jgi:hypothetical protein
MHARNTTGAGHVTVKMVLFKLLGPSRLSMGPSLPISKHPRTDLPRTDLPRTDLPRTDLPPQRGQVRFLLEQGVCMIHTSNCCQKSRENKIGIKSCSS